MKKKKLTKYVPIILKEHKKLTESQEIKLQKAIEWSNKVYNEDFKELKDA